METSIAWTQFPPSVDVLTLHGLRDGVVPPYDAFIYARIYGARKPGTHTLRYVEEADHNFTGVSTPDVTMVASLSRSHQIPEEVNDTVLEWMAQQERNELTTGLWHTGLRNKL